MVRREISQETVNLLIDIIKETVGEGGLKSILRRLEGQNLKGRELVYAFAEEMMNVYGQKGSYALIRQLGRDLAKRLMEKYPREVWKEVLERALAEFGFANKIELEEDRAGICSCVFYELLSKNNFKPIEHAVCWCGWGFIEGFVKELKGVKGIEWKERDYEKEICFFEFLK